MKEIVNIQALKNRKSILMETAKQVQSDFAMFGFKIVYAENEDWIYEQLFHQTDQHIQHLLEKEHGKLFSLLYYIDVNEDSIAAAKITHPDFSLSEIIAELVLYRELKKVATRLYFKENPEKLKNL